MLKLLRAGGIRYIKSSLLWVCVVAAFLIGAFTDALTDLGEVYILLIFITYAILLTMTVGREFDEGVIKNKVIIGHTKGIIFTSELLLGILVSVCVFLSCAIGYACAHLKPFETMSAEIMIKTFLGFLLLNILMAEIFIVCCFIVRSKAKTVVINTLVILVMLFSAYRIQGALMRPEFLTERRLVDGEIIEVAVGENPEYIDGALREFYEITLYTLPLGQALEYNELNERYYKTSSNGIPEHTDAEMKVYNLAPIYSAVLCGGVFCIGYFTFRKKDLK